METLARQARAIIDEERRRLQRYWEEHEEHWKQQQEQPCSLCGRKVAGYPFIWWSFPREHIPIPTLTRLGEIPELVCPDCFGHYRVLTEVWRKPEAEVLTQLLKDRNWRLWLEELARKGYNDASIGGGDEGRWAFVVQLYDRWQLLGDTSPAAEAYPVPIYLVHLPDASSDPFEEGVANIARITRGYDFAEVVRGTDELREYLRLGPEAWHAARRNEGEECLLTVEQAAERLGLSLKTAYKYCSRFYAYGEYGPLVPDEQEEGGTTKKRSERKLFSKRTRQGDIRVPAWAILLFQMQYEGAPPHPLTTLREDVRLLLPHREAYRYWEGRRGKQKVTWLPRFRSERGEGQQRGPIPAELADIEELPLALPGVLAEFSREFLQAHPCPPQEEWLIKEVIETGGPVVYDAQPHEYWTMRSRQEYARLLYENPAALESPPWSLEAFLREGEEQ